MSGVRPGGLFLEQGIDMVLKTTPLQWGFNAPFQLGNVAKQVLNTVTQEMVTESDDENFNKPTEGTIYSYQCNHFDVIILATDGLFDNLYDRDVSQILVKHLADVPSRYMLNKPIGDGFVGKEAVVGYRNDEGTDFVANECGDFGNQVMTIRKVPKMIQQQLQLLPIDILSNNGYEDVEKDDDVSWIGEDIDDALEEIYQLALKRCNDDNSFTPWSEGVEVELEKRRQIQMEQLRAAITVAPPSEARKFEAMLKILEERPLEDSRGGKPDDITIILAVVLPPKEYEVQYPMSKL